jgi:hypothetical protein
MEISYLCCNNKTTQKKAELIALTTQSIHQFRAFGDFGF